MAIEGGGGLMGFLSFPKLNKNVFPLVNICVVRSTLIFENENEKK